jgi:Berberine and berberine like
VAAAREETRSFAKMLVTCRSIVRSLSTSSSKAAGDMARRWLMQSWVTTRPWGSGRVFPNFPDPDLDDWGHAYYGANYERLLRIKETFDPDNVFRFHQSLVVTPAKRRAHG